MISMTVRFLLIYVVAWWLVLFMVLPFKANAPKKPKKGLAASAPEKTYLGIKILITSSIALVIAIIAVYFLKKYGAF